MAKHAFSAGFSGDADALFRKLQAALQEHGGALDGDRNSGSIKVSAPMGKVEGTYRVEGASVRIELTRVPFLVPVSMIESMLAKEIAKI